MTIRFFKEEVAFNLKKKRKISNWLKKIVHLEMKTIDSLNYVFVTNEIILEINKKYLKHNYYTDIITFDNSTTKNNISGEMYISIDTVKQNAKEYQVDFQCELLRVMLHGILHLCGYKDNTEKQQQEMRKIENKYLKIFE